MDNEGYGHQRTRSTHPQDRLQQAKGYSAHRRSQRTISLRGFDSQGLQRVPQPVSHRPSGHHCARFQNSSSAPLSRSKQHQASSRQTVSQQDTSQSTVHITWLSFCLTVSGTSLNYRVSSESCHNAHVLHEHNASA